MEKDRLVTALNRLNADLDEQWSRVGLMQRWLEDHSSRLEHLSSRLDSSMARLDALLAARARSAR